MQHFATTQDWSQDELQALLSVSSDLKRQPWQPLLNGKTVALLFLNPSLRTRASFQVGANQLGAQAIVLEPGNGSWGIEFDAGKVMDGSAEEHISEVAQVLSRYADLICIRAFPTFENWQYDREDPFIKAIIKHATVPVINMETIVHPCQELALMQTLQEKLGDVAGKQLTVAWTWHPRPLNTAVANSAILIATKFGMNVKLLCPDANYLLDKQFLQGAAANAEKHSGSFAITHDISDGYTGADIVYAKSWGALPYYGDTEAGKQSAQDYKHFIVNQDKMNMTNDALFSHCLPLRRNVKATDEVMDADYCVAIDEAENRLHVQKAIMLKLLQVGSGEVAS